jgi:membrane protease YdiL (CAAX protease family)
MKTVTRFVKNNSFVVFVVLAYIFSWWLVPLNAGMLPVGPLLAALLVVGLSEGKAGVKAWGSQVVRRGSDWRWYAVAVAIPLVITFIVAGLNFLLGAQLVAPIDWTIPFKILPIMLVFSGMWEEPGWTGYALPHLYKRFGPSLAGTLSATLVMAVIRTGWHLPLMLSGDIYWSDIVLVIAAQFVFTWLFNRTGGVVLAVMLFHLMNNIISGVFVGAWFTGTDWVQLSWLLAGLWSFLAVGLLALDGPHLGRNEVLHAEIPPMSQQLAQK